MLKGRRAFITGSFQGIGLGIATALAAEGAAIVLHGLADEATIAKAEKAILALAGTNVSYSSGEFHGAAADYGKGKASVVLPVRDFFGVIFSGVKAIFHKSISSPAIVI